MTELCHFRYDAASVIFRRQFIKKCPECMLQLPIPVKSGNILRILLVWLHSRLDFFRLILCFPNDIFPGFTWWTVGGSLMEQKHWQKVTQFRRRPYEQSQPRILLLCLVSLELFFFNVFHVLTETP